ncbi:c-type cytochrome [Novosphingobium flavum]|uniref:C-type cytochrome n=1 Tax=Novosphingobium flavum TaxID=1778672 RepID=A0A7X1KLP3_9SPHN|nr:c-type cytochrome [Novosphingobium flavum]MBC2665430.1 c-type cytochrome [Novosphingobium flavum]
MPTGHETGGRSARKPRYQRAIASLLLGLSIALAAAALTGRVEAQTEDSQYTAQAILDGARLFTANCQLCHGENGNGVGGVDLARQQFKTVRTDDDIIALLHNGVPSAGMPAFASFQREQAKTLVAYIRAGFAARGAATAGGDAERGKALFTGKGGCARCHVERGVGPHAAPNLANIGAIRLPADIERSILDPARAMLPINRPIRIVLRGGRVIEGRRLNEDTYTVQLAGSDSTLISLSKADIRTYEKSASPAMPSYAGRFTAAEMADLLTYLIALKGI